MKKILLRIRLWWLERQIDLSRFDPALSLKIDALIKRIDDG